jgi:hypothetical protein
MWNAGLAQAVNELKEAFGMKVRLHYGSYYFEIVLPYH